MLYIKINIEQDYPLKMSSRVIYLPFPNALQKTLTNEVEEKISSRPLKVTPLIYLC
jgi:hypothetical protein